jgi:signal transduction histidine kinase
MEMYTFLGLSTFFIGLVSLTTGTIMYLKNRKSLVNKTFALFCFFLIIWSFGSFFYFTPHSKELSFFSFRIMHVGVLFVTVSYFHFICALLKIIPEKRVWIYFGYLIQVLFLPLVFTKLIFADVVPKFSFAFWPVLGPLYHVWLAIWWFYLIYSAVLIFSAFKKSTGLKKSQLRYILVGGQIAFGGSLLNFPLFYGFNIPPVLNILISAQIISYAYVTIRYRSLDWQENFLNSLKKIFSFILAVIIGTFICYLSLFYKTEIFAFLLFIIISLTSYLSLTTFFSSHFFHHLLRLNYLDNFKKAINTLYEQQSFYTSLEELQAAIEKIFVQELKINSAKMLFLNSTNKGHYGELIKYFEANPNSYLDLEEITLQKEEIQKDPPFFYELKELGELCLPIWDRRKKIIGFFVLGKKHYENPYSKAELKILKSAVLNISISLRILQYNEDLRQEVEDSTKKLREQAQKLKNSYAELQKLDQAKDSFLSIASHELRTPMTVIKGYSEFLLSEKFGSLNVQQKDFMRRIANSTESLLVLVKDILDVSKLEADCMDFHFSNINVNDFLKNEVSEFALICENKNISLSFVNPNNTEFSLLTDAEKLKMILNNLLGNAYKFTSEGGKITVSVHKDEKSNFLRFEVKDTGIGIPKDKLDIIFKKFQQVNNYLQKKHNGTGLGLAIVKKVITKLNGKVWVESEFNKGSNFIFLLPYKQRV